MVVTSEALVLGEMLIVPEATEEDGRVVTAVIPEDVPQPSLEQMEQALDTIGRQHEARQHASDAHVAEQIEDIEGLTDES